MAKSWKTLNEKVDQHYFNKIPEKKKKKYPVKHQVMIPIPYENKKKIPFCNNKSLKSAKTFPYTDKALVDVSSWTL